MQDGMFKAYVHTHIYSCLQSLIIYDMGMEIGSITAKRSGRLFYKYDPSNLLAASVNKTTWLSSV